MATKPASLKPVVHQKLELDLDEGATRVHKFPKELIHRLREQETAKAASSSPPPDDRTAVFRAPPELLARAMRARLSAQGADEAAQIAEAARPNDLPTKPPPAGTDDEIADSGVQYMSENTSGISLRPAGLGGFEAVPAGRASLSEHGPAVRVEADASPEPAADEGWSFPEPALDDPTLIRSEGLSLLPSFASHVAQPADESPPISLVESDPVTEALLNTDVDALLAPAAPPAHTFGFTAAPAPAPVAEPSPSPASVAVPSAPPAPARASNQRVLLVAMLLVLAVLAFAKFALR